MSRGVHSTGLARTHCAPGSHTPEVPGPTCARAGVRLAQGLSEALYPGLQSPGPLPAPSYALGLTAPTRPHRGAPLPSPRFHEAIFCPSLPGPKSLGCSEDPQSTLPPADMRALAPTAPTPPRARVTG